MRYLLVTIASVCALLSFAQTPYGREKVVEVDTTTTPEVLRAAVRKWFIDTYRDADAVIQMDDASTNTIVGKGWTEFGPNGELHHTVEVACKKGRARVRIYDVYHQGRGHIGYGTGAVTAPSWGQLFDEERCFVHSGGAIMEKRMFKECVRSRPEIEKRLDSLVTSLETALRAQRGSSGDW